MRTVIVLNSDTKRSSGRARKKDYRKELQQIVSQIDSAKNHLAELCVEMDEDDLEIAEVDEALDALDDAIDILEDALEEEE